MRKLLNTLYVTTTESYLARDGENVVIRAEYKEKFRMPIHNIEGIVCFGYMGASPALMHLCATVNRALCFLTEHGRFLCRVEGAVSGNVLLRRKQYRLADDVDQSVELAKLFVAGKIANCRTVLQRSFRDQNPGNNLSELESAIQLLALKQKQVLRISSAKVLRGVEGEAAQSYFGVFRMFN